MIALTETLGKWSTSLSVECEESSTGCVGILLRCAITVYGYVCPLHWDDLLFHFLLEVCREDVIVSHDGLCVQKC